MKNPQQNNFPNPDHLWRGCLQASIIHAIMAARYPDLSHEHSWDGFNYSVQDSGGSRGTIAFDGKNPRRLVAIFFSPEIPKGSFNNLDIDRNEGVFRGFPKDLDTLRNEALQYMLEDNQGIIAPSLTAAFWCQDGHAGAACSWPELLKRGARLIERQLLEMEPAFSAWREYYSMDPWQVDLGRELLKLKLQSTLNTPEIDPAWRKLLTEERGFDEACEAFAEIGILCQKHGGK